MVDDSSVQKRTEEFVKNDDFSRKTQGELTKFGMNTIIYLNSKYNILNSNREGA